MLRLEGQHCCGRCGSGGCVDRLRAQEGGWAGYEQSDHSLQAVQATTRAKKEEDCDEQSDEEQ